MISKEIGWSAKSNMLYEIARQTEKLVFVSGKWVQSRKNSTVPMTETNLKNLGLSSENIDARLIFLASIGITLQLIDIRGNESRTSASDAAVSKLIDILDNLLFEKL